MCLITQNCRSLPDIGCQNDVAKLVTVFVRVFVTVLLTNYVGLKMPSDKL